MTDRLEDTGPSVQIIFVLVIRRETPACFLVAARPPEFPLGKEPRPFLNVLIILHPILMNNISSRATLLSRILENEMPLFVY